MPRPLGWRPMNSGSITTENLVPAGEATAASAIEVLVHDAGIVAVQVSGTYTGALSAQARLDGGAWVTLTAATTITNAATGAQSATIASGATGLFRVGVGGYAEFRVTALAAVTGTATVTVRAGEQSSTASSSGSSASLSNLIGPGGGYKYAVTGDGLPTGWTGTGWVYAIRCITAGTVTLYDNSSAAGTGVITALPMVANDVELLNGGAGQYFEVSPWFDITGGTYWLVGQEV